MRIIYIAAGAGGLHCGACARDANLARALLGLGWDVQLIPLYTPLKLDTLPPPGTTRTFFGGINAFLQQHVALFRHTPRFVDRLLDSRLFLGIASKFAIKTKARELGPMTVSMLRGEEGRQRKELERLLRFLESGPRPNIVNLTNSMLLGLVPALRKRIPAAVVCSLEGEDEFVGAIPEPHRSEARDLMRKHAREIDLFVSPSDAYAGTMAEFLDVPRDKIRTVHTGIDEAAYPPTPSRPREPFTVGCLSRIAEGNGLDVLIESLRILVKEQERDVHLKVAGQICDKNLWGLLRGMVGHDDLDARFHYCRLPDLRSKVGFLHGCSAFAAPARQPPIRGTAVLEAMAAGVPVVASDCGVFSETLKLAPGAALVPPGDPKLLANELAALMDDPDKADALGLAAHDGICLHYSAARMAERTRDLYISLLSN